MRALNFCVGILLLAFFSFAHSSTYASYIVNLPTDSGALHPVTYTDLTIQYTVVRKSKSSPGYKRSINVRVKSQPQAFFNINPLQSPIVIYSHGGGAGNVNGHDDAGQPWTDELVKQGFITINIGHAGVEKNSELAAVCSKVNLDDVNDSIYLSNFQNPSPYTDPANALDQDQPLNINSDCAYFQATQYLRFRDVHAVLNRLTTTITTAVPNLPNQWDGSLALMGHSAGTGVVMNFAGATRSIIHPTNTYVVANPARFDAYIALSPQGPLEKAPYTNGFAAGAWDDVDQPFLHISGDADSTNGQPDPANRRVPYDTMVGEPANENKHLLWFTDTNIIHSRMSLTPSNSVPLDEPYNVMKEVVVRFLDIYTRNKTTLALDDVFADAITPSYAEFTFEKK